MVIHQDTRNAALRCAGAWTGTLAVDLDGTVADLKQALAQASGLPEQRDLKLISGGRSLVVASKSLHACGLKDNSKLLVLLPSNTAASRISAQEKAVEEAAARTAHLQRIKAAAAAIAKRDSRYGSDGTYQFSLENQSGQAMNIGKEDREAIVTALMLHESAKNLLAEEQYQDALNHLLIAEEAADLCSGDLLAVVDNLGIMLLDIVWCYFMLQDTSKLAEAQARLRRAREQLHRSYGPNLERMRVLHGNFTPELAIFVRLETLEGVAAFHRQDRRQATASLQAAHGKLERLQVDDQALALLAGMGLPARESRRALQFCGGDVDRAAEFGMEQLQKAQARSAQTARERQTRCEARRLGRTRDGKAVDMAALEQLTALSYPRRLAAEALKQTNNSLHAALDLLSNPASNEALQIGLRASADRAKPADNAALVAMGFDDQDVRAALQQLPAGASMQQAVDRLVAADGASAVPVDDAGQEGDASAAGPAHPPGASGEDAIAAMASDLEEMESEPRDAEMEESLAHSVSTDPLAAYDIDVSQEGQAILQYLALLDGQPASAVT